MAASSDSVTVRWPVLPLGASVSSLFLAGIFVTFTVQGHYSLGLLLLCGLPALALAALGLGVGSVTLKKRPPGAPYGFAMGGTLLGGFSLVFWTVMVPLLFLIMLPAMSLEPEDELLAESQRQMRVIIRQAKAFHRDHGRLPESVEEMVALRLIPARLLIDPRHPAMRDQPAYRLMIREMPPEALWEETPILEGRFPDASGRRLVGFLDEHIGVIY